jgi:A/G-specific adenine glycosylase
MRRKSTPPNHSTVVQFRRLLLRWYRRHGRDLPWRRTRDPYRIVVSEFMLQQTQVSRVLPYYERFLIRYPTLEALATAPAGAVRESWEGLGYYRRAANLHRLARHVVRHRAGIIPADPAELRTLPGVGRYTAGAVASFAFEQPTPAVDTNVERVLRRAFLWHSRRTAWRSMVWQTAHRVMPRRGKTAWTFNQAMMELGALICTARVAHCGECPVRRACGTGQATIHASAFSTWPASRRQEAPAGPESRRSTPRSAGAAGAHRSRRLPRPRDPAGPAWPR